jgi:hypothetical protein
MRRILNLVFPHSTLQLHLPRSVGFLHCCVFRRAQRPSKKKIAPMKRQLASIAISRILVLVCWNVRVYFLRWNCAIVCDVMSLVSLHVCDFISSTLRGVSSVFGIFRFAIHFRLKFLSSLAMFFHFAAVTSFLSIPSPASRNVRFVKIRENKLFMHVSPIAR